MIARLRGIIAEQGSDRLTVDVQGVGYEVLVTTRVAEAAILDAPTLLFVHMAVREDAITLYGFTTPADKSVFELLIGVNGVGPKLALSALGSLNVPDFARAIEANDLRTLSSIPGVGKKTAERLVLELRGKLAFTPAALSTAQAAPDDALPLALAQLGYKRSEIDLALQKLAERGLSDAPTQQRLAESLKILSAR